jgi:hypothetical protein
MDTKRSVVLSELLDLHKDCGLERHGLNLVTHICLSIVVIVDVSTLRSQYSTLRQFVKGVSIYILVNPRGILLLSQRRHWRQTGQ